jgi:hypothetical protein
MTTRKLFVEKWRRRWRRWRPRSVSRSASTPRRDGVIVHCDRDRVIQVLSNLIGKLDQSSRPTVVRSSSRPSRTRNAGRW